MENNGVEVEVLRPVDDIASAGLVALLFAQICSKRGVCGSMAIRLINPWVLLDQECRSSLLPKKGRSQGDRIILTILPFLSHSLCYAAPIQTPVERSRPMADPTNASIVEHFRTLEDPRIERTKKHLLLDILAQNQHSCHQPQTHPQCSIRESLTLSPLLPDSGRRSAD